MKELPTKPYFIRAIYEWCIDNNLTPYLLVRADDEIYIPIGRIVNNEITFNISRSAVSKLTLGNDAIHFSARFNGILSDIFLPIGTIKEIFASETGQGMFFLLEETSGVKLKEINLECISKPESTSHILTLPSNKKHQLRVVK